jgi:hypothetical protein
VKENLHEQIVFEEKLGVWLEIRAASAGYFTAPIISQFDTFN